MFRFTLKNIRNNLKQSWTQLLEGETLEDLFDGVCGAVEIHKIDVWWNCYEMLNINGISVFQVENSNIINIVVNIIIISTATNLSFVSAMTNDMLN